MKNISDTSLSGGVLANLSLKTLLMILGFSLTTACGQKPEESETKSITAVVLLGELVMKTAEAAFDGLIEFVEEPFLEQLIHGEEEGAAAEDSYQAISKTLGVELKNFHKDQVKIEVNTIVRELERDFAPGATGHSAHLLDLISRVNRIVETIEFQSTQDESLKSFAAGFVPSFQTYQLMSNILIFLEKSRMRSSIEAGASQETIAFLRNGIRQNTLETIAFLTMIVDEKLPESIKEKFAKSELIVVQSVPGLVFDTEVVYGYSFDREDTPVLKSDLICSSDADRDCLTKAREDLDKKKLAYINAEVSRVKEELFGSGNPEFNNYMNLLKNSIEE